MGKLVGAVSTAVIGLVLAGTASWGLVRNFDPDTSPQVQEKLDSEYNPLNGTGTVYGTR